MVKKLSSWNVFVKQVFEEGKKSNKSFSFKDALKEASERKKRDNTKVNLLLTQTNTITTNLTVNLKKEEVEKLEKVEKPENIENPESIKIVDY